MSTIEQKRDITRVHLHELGFRLLWESLAEVRDMLLDAKADDALFTVHPICAEDKLMIRPSTVIAASDGVRPFPLEDADKPTEVAA